MPSTSTPKIIWVRTESSICIRGSAEGSFERRRKMRPSSGFSLRLLGNEIEKLGPEAYEKEAETKSPVINATGTTVRLRRNIKSPCSVVSEKPADCTTNDACEWSFQNVWHGHPRPGESSLTSKAAGGRPRHTAAAFLSRGPWPTGIYLLLPDLPTLGVTPG